LKITSRMHFYLMQTVQVATSHKIRTKTPPESHYQWLTDNFL
jgi:hypothetical protein